MYDVIIIGAGIIGSSVAYYLSQYDIKVAILEASNDVSNGTSKANSGIIHAGYDPKENSLMAKFNVEGAKITKEICRKLDVPYNQCGALVVGYNDEDINTINTLYKRGLNNGVENIEIIDREKLIELEPQINPQAKCALYCKDSAIVSPWELTYALAETAVKNGVKLFLENEVTCIEKCEETFVVTTKKDKYQARYIVNAAGIYADKVNEMIGKKQFTIIPVKGDYYLLDKSESSKVHHTIFQCPDKDGKGELVSITVDGNVIVGPDAKVVEKIDTSTTSSSLDFVKRKAYKTISTLDFSENIRNFAGIRAKSDRDDFIIEESKDVKNFFNIAGIASPGLSSALAIGKYYLDWLIEKETFQKKEHYIDTRKKIRVRELSVQQKDELIKKNPLYGRIICRCETVTEGEIVDSMTSIIPAVSLDGVKRRTNAQMGRCQGGFCSEKIALLLMKYHNLSYKDILQDDVGSNILLSRAKEK